MDNVQGAHGFSGHCQVCPDFVQGISGQCPHFPLSPWTLSRESMDIVQGESGQCPLSPSTLSSLSGLPGLCPEYPRTLSRLSTDSMDNVHCPGSPWTLSRKPMDSVDILQSGTPPSGPSFIQILALLLQYFKCPKTWDIYSRWSLWLRDQEGLKMCYF